MPQPESRLVELIKNSTEYRNFHNILSQRDISDTVIDALIKSIMNKTAEILCQQAIQKLIK